MVGRFAYATGLLDRRDGAALDRLLPASLLGAMASDETRRVAATLEMLDDAERALLLGGFGDAPAPLPAQPRGACPVRGAGGAHARGSRAGWTSSGSWRYAEPSA